MKQNNEVAEVLAKLSELARQAGFSTEVQDWLRDWSVKYEVAASDAPGRRA